MFERVHFFLQLPFNLIGHVLEDYKPDGGVGRTLLSAAFEVDFGLGP